MAEPQTNAAQPGSPNTAENWSTVWARAEEATKDVPDDTDASKADPAEAGGEGTDDATASDDAADDAGDEKKPDAKADGKDADEDEAKDDKKADAKKPEGNEEIRTLHELAKKHGFVVDRGLVTTEERANFRAEKRKFHEKAETDKRTFVGQVQAAWQKLQPLAQAKELAEAGDIDGAMKALIGKDLSEVNKLQADKLRNRDPRLDQQEKRIAEFEERERQREAAEQQAREEYQRKAEMQRHMSELTSTFTSSEAKPEHKKLAAMGPHFVQLVYAKQNEHWDGYDTISPEDAATLVEKDLRADYDILHSVFGDRDASSPESSSASASVGRGNDTPARTDGNGKKPSKTLPKRRAAEASPPGSRQLTEAEWVQANTRRMRQSEADDR